MADEITDQNRIAVWRLPSGLWTARIGPADGRGVQAAHSNPTAALWMLFRKITSGGWAFDHSWKPETP